MTYKFKYLSEGALVVQSCLGWGSEFKVDLCEVHTYRLASESCEEGLNEVKGEALIFRCSCGLELTCIDTIYIKRDPITTILWLVILVDLPFYLVKIVPVTVIRLKDQALVVFHELCLVIFVRAYSKVAYVFQLNALPLLGQWYVTSKIAQWHTMGISTGWAFGSVSVKMSIEP